MTDRELIIDRVFDAPRPLVFKVWTEPEHVAQWWGPRGFTITTHEMAVRPGGVWRYVMHGPDGVDYDNYIIFTEVVEPERLVYTHSSGEADDPGQFQVTVTFAEQGDKTQLSIYLLFASAEELNKVVKEFGAIEGANQTLDRLAEHLVEI